MRPVGRRDAGLYTCQAQNSVGTSEQLSVQLDIKCEYNLVIQHAMQFTRDNTTLTTHCIAFLN